MVAGNQRRVLLVDDEQPLLRALARSLGNRYDLTTSSSAESALRLVAAEAWDAVVSDVMMPGIDGVEFARRALGLRPELAGRIVLMSGVQPKHAQHAGFPLLMKPFGVEQLRALLEQLTNP